MKYCKNYKKQQEVCGIIIEINQIIHFLININADEKVIDDNGNEVDNPIYDANKVGKNETEIVISLKYLSNFWRSLDIPLINCEVEIILTWTKNCVLADMTAANNPPTGLDFQIKDAKL